LKKKIVVCQDFTFANKISITHLRP